MNTPIDSTVEWIDRDIQIDSVRIGNKKIALPIPTIVISDNR